jgi:uncharacterized protein
MCARRLTTAAPTPCSPCPGSDAAVGLTDPEQLTAAKQPADVNESRLTALVFSSIVLMRALRAARDLDAPDWLIGAGLLRDRVWDHLHGFTRTTTRDVDLAFFDSSRLLAGHERELQHAITQRAPDMSWEATNQAALHLWYPQVFGIRLEPLTCSADAVAMWPETATAVAIRLLHDNTLDVVAPYGLDDLFNCVWRRNPAIVTREQFHRRVQNKQIAKRWPRVRVLDAPEESPFRTRASGV